MHEIVSSVNCFIFFFQVGFYRAIFFDTSVSHTAYLNLLQAWFVPQLRETGLETTAVLQQDGAPAHVALPVRECLDDRFSGRWIGRGSDMVWPPRSPDLTTCDNSL
jgi:hypothetical protein